MNKVKPLLLIVCVASISTFCKGESITQTYTSTISNLCSNRICFTDFKTIVFDLPDGFADHLEVIGVDISYNMTGDCNLSNSSRVVCSNTDIASPIEQGSKSSQIKTVSHTNLNIANGIYSKSTDIEFDMELVGGSCLCTSANCDIIASTWTITLHFNLVYFNSICEVAQLIDPYDNSPCCDEYVEGDTYLAPDRWYYFHINQYDYTVDFNSLNSSEVSTTYYYTESDCSNLTAVSSFSNIPSESIGYIWVSCDEPIQGNCDGNSFELCISTIPVKADINYGDSCFNNNLIQGCTDKWYSFIATGTSLSYTTCTEDFSNATTTLYKGLCAQFVSLSSHEVGFEECNETQFSGLIPGEEYWIHVSTDNDGCGDRITSLCLIMNSPCDTDLLLEGEIVDEEFYEFFKSITLDNVQLKAPGSLLLTATESINILENSTIESNALLETIIVPCKELTCGDGYDDDEDGILDCDDPDCINQLPLCALVGTLFLDGNKNGIKNNEQGIEGLEVQLFTEGDNPLLDDPFAITLSDADGNYVFIDLDAGNYFVYISSGDIYSPSVSPSQINEDNGIDNDNNGIQSDLNNDNVTDGPIISPLISLCPGTEPIGDSDDDDGDMTIDIGFTTAGCMSTYECDCNDGIDNDNNGDVDCADQYCDPLTSYTETCNCNDGIDNDLDQLIDCADPDCAHIIYQYECNCNDGIDNDGDGLIDTYDDNECV